MADQRKFSSARREQGVAEPPHQAMDEASHRKALVFAIMRALALFSVVAAIGLYACSERVERPPTVAAPPLQLPAVKPAPPPIAVGTNWEDWPATPGDWAYRRDPRGSVALFGPPGTDALFLLRCDRQAARVYASRNGTFPAGETGRMTIRASAGLQTYSVSNTSDASYVAAEIIPTDRHLDAMAYSRGRFVVSVKGATDLVVPAWPEVTRVIEDCR
jgi:hypothetical protein